MMVLSPGVRGVLSELAREAYPAECCGHLLGEAGRIRRILPAANGAKDSRRGFRISPEANLRALREAGREGEEVLGFFHSHPDGLARPSREDRARAFEGSLHLLIPVTDGAVGILKAWRIGTGEVHEIRLGEEGVS